MVSPDEKARLIAQEGWFSMYDFPDEAMPNRGDFCCVEVMLCDGTVIAASRHWHYPCSGDSYREEDWFSDDPCVWDKKNGRLVRQQEPFLWRPFADDAALREATEKKVARERAEWAAEQAERDSRDMARSFNRGWFDPKGGAA